jgi:membrane protease YdiL (CAAX protease family)
MLIFLLLWAGLLFAARIFLPKRLKEFLLDEPVDILLVPAAALLAAGLVSLLFFLVVEKRKIKLPLLTRPLRDIGLSLFSGVFWIGGTLGLFFLTDSILLARSDSLPQFGYWILAVVLTVAAQELLLRGYLFSLLQEKYSGVAAICVTSVLYVMLNGTALASGTFPLLFAFTASALLGLLRLYTGGILAPFLAHLIWNGVGGLVLGSVSIGTGAPSLFTESARTVEMVAGGALKFEGSAIALIVTFFLVDLLFILIQERDAGLQTAD